MSLIIKEKNYELATEGLHEAFFSKIDDLGMQETPYGNKEQVLFFITLLDQLDSETDEPIVIRLYASKSLNAKSTIGKMLAQLKIPVTGEIDIMQLVNQKIKIVVQQRENKEGNVRAYVALFMPFKTAPKKAAAVSTADVDTI